MGLEVLEYNHVVKARKEHGCAWCVERIVAGEDSDHLV
jgi:hypothetical protein